jgi:hypothetical protein
MSRRQGDGRHLGPLRRVGDTGHVPASSERDEADKNDPESEPAPDQPAPHSPGTEAAKCESWMAAARAAIP